MKTESGGYIKTCRCGCGKEFVTMHRGKTIMTDCAFRIAQERAVATAARKKQTKRRFIKTCICGCGKAFGVIHNGQVVRNECRVAWDKKRNREQSQRKRDDIKKIGPPKIKRVPQPIHLQNVPVEKMEAAISAMIRDQS